jgi:tetratricopeptide (TPR) repeat protein
MPSDTSKNATWSELRRVFFLVAVVALSFVPSLFNAFVYWDDDAHLLENALATSKDWAAVPLIFQSVVNKTYVPLTILSFNLEHHVFGLNPFLFHLDNLLLHAAVCGLIYRFAQRIGLNRNAALMGALLFGIHPMHVEPVAWVTARKDVLYSLFYLLAMDRYWGYLADGKKHSYVLSLVFAFLSILAKPMALSLPLILGLLTWYHDNRIKPRAFLGLLPFFAVIIPVAWVTYHLNSRLPGLNAAHSFLLWSWSATFYLKKFLTPFVLLPLYQVPQPVSFWNPSYFSGVVLFALIPVVMFWQRHNRLFVLAGLFYILSTFFLWRYDYAVDVTIVADRFMYLPSLGLCLVFADALTKRPQLKWITIGIIIFCILQTSAQCRVWANDLSLWNHVIGHKQEVFLAYNSRGVAFVKDKQYDLAWKDFNRALELNPRYARGYYNRGKLYEGSNKFDEALADFDQAITISGKDPRYFTERGVVHSKRKEFDKAIEDFTAALNITPDDAGIYNNLGIVYAKTGKFEEALKTYAKALELNPNSFQSYINRANLWQESGHNDEAFKDLKKAQELGFPVDAARLKYLSNP